jgi:hypothetical protein
MKHNWMLPDTLLTALMPKHFEDLESDEELEKFHATVNKVLSKSLECDQNSVTVSSESSGTRKVSWRPNFSVAHSTVSSDLSRAKIPSTPHLNRRSRVQEAAAPNGSDLDQ